jgi:hypothetical protein
MHGSHLGAQKSMCRLWLDGSNYNYLEEWYISKRSFLNFIYIYIAIKLRVHMFVFKEPKKRKLIKKKLNLIKYPSEFPKTQKNLDKLSLFKVIIVALITICKLFNEFNF